VASSGFEGTSTGLAGQEQIVRTRRTAARFLVTGVLAAALTWSGAGTVGAAPPSDPGPSRSTTGSATAVLSGPESGLTVFLDAFAPPGEASFARLEIFVAGFECLTEESVPAELDGLDSASAGGELTLICGSPQGEVTALADVEVVWEGTGRVARTTLAGPGRICVVQIRAREATVTGTVEVTIPELEIQETAVPEFGELRLATELCPPRR
jgi:hypothetical protein